MHRTVNILISLFFLACTSQAYGEITQKVVDIPTRPGVVQRMLVLSLQDPKAAVILFAGGHGGLQITPRGSFGWGENNFLVRTRQLFADQGLLVTVVDAPSDRQSSPYLGGFRQSPGHLADIKAVIAWVRAQTKVPVWLVGTSRGTQSAAYIATELNVPEGPDGLVLSSTILTDDKGRPVPAMPLGKLRIPVLVVHHEQDGCSHTLFKDVPTLMERLDGPGSIGISDGNGNSVKFETSGITVNASAKIAINASQIEISSGMVTVDAGMSRFGGVVQCDTLIANGVVSASYSPGAGNIW